MINVCRVVKSTVPNLSNARIALSNECTLTFKHFGKTSLTRVSIPTVGFSLHISTNSTERFPFNNNPFASDPIRSTAFSKRSGSDFAFEGLKIKPSHACNHVCQVMNAITHVFFYGWFPLGVICRRSVKNSLVSPFSFMRGAKLNRETKNFSRYASNLRLMETSVYRMLTSVTGQPGSASEQPSWWLQRLVGSMLLLSHTKNFKKPYSLLFLHGAQHQKDSVKNARKFARCALAISCE